MALQRRTSFTGRITLLTVLVFVVTACAGNSLNKVNSDASLPTELPKDFQDKFEISDSELTKNGAVTDIPAPQPSPEPTKASGKERKKKAKKGEAIPAVLKTDEAKPSTVPEGFIYPMRRPAVDPIWVGEKLTYSITYFGVQAGEFTLESLPYKKINNRKVYHIKGNATSSKVFSLFYRLNDTVETFIDFESLFPHRFHLVLDETKQTRDSLELYEPEKARSFYWNRWNRVGRNYVEVKDFFPTPPLSQDTLSSLYYLRTVPLPTGAVFFVPIACEGKSWSAQVTVVRREMMDTPFGRVQTVVLKPEMQYQGVLKKQGDSFIWVTDDERRIAVRLEAKVRIGTVVAVLKKAELGTSPVGQPNVAPAALPAIYGSPE